MSGTIYAVDSAGGLHTLTVPDGSKVFFTHHAAIEHAEAVHWQAARRRCLAISTGTPLPDERRPGGEAEADPKQADPARACVGDDVTIEACPRCLGNPYRCSCFIK